MLDADVEFGDLTVLVGPQATGKSIFLQMLKLVIDNGSVVEVLRRYGLTWRRDAADFLGVYLGEGMQAIWVEGQSQATVDGAPWPVVTRTAPSGSRNTNESLLYIPAQRVLVLREGWPLPFEAYRPGDPFVVRQFSEKLRQLMGQEFTGPSALFPRPGRLKAEIRKRLEVDVFQGAEVTTDLVGPQRRFVLRPAGAATALPSMVWSAGQREFVPLLVGLYWLLPAGGITRRDDLRWATIEEPEMGLHPRAIADVLLLVLDLLSRGYRVCLSSHSPHTLDLVWAIRLMQEHGAEPRRVLQLFDVPATAPMKGLAEAALRKSFRVHYFDPGTGISRDISALDVDSDDLVEAEWGGLTAFSGQVADVVMDVVNEAPRRGNA
ncbi:MAG: ATP-binding protein [Armatimonadetes bacterium]|nr:ATP-binding protein [Armatimonadota bacterium]